MSPVLQMDTLPPGHLGSKPKVVNTYVKTCSFYSSHIVYNFHLYWTTNASKPGIIVESFLSTPATDMTNETLSMTWAAQHILSTICGCLSHFSGCLSISFRSLERILTEGLGDYFETNVHRAKGLLLLMYVSFIHLLKYIFKCQQCVRYYSWCCGYSRENNRQYFMPHGIYVNTEDSD